jgi:hypothetical protein
MKNYLLQPQTKFLRYSSNKLPPCFHTNPLYSCIAPLEALRLPCQLEPTPTHSTETLSSKTESRFRPRLGILIPLFWFILHCNISNIPYAENTGHWTTNFREQCQQHTLKAPPSLSFNDHLIHSSTSTSPRPTSKHNLSFFTHTIPIYPIKYSPRLCSKHTHCTPQIPSSDST